MNWVCTICEEQASYLHIYFKEINYSPAQILVAEPLRSVRIEGRVGIFPVCRLHCNNYFGDPDVYRVNLDEKRINEVERKLDGVR